MSLFRNALEPAGLWALMALLPLAVLALYFLKLKRAPLEVPSTYLWHKSIEDLHVNSLWQRLRRSLLLLLQMLLLALIILALLRPGWEGERLEGRRIIFAVDNSASMGAVDLEGAETRLAEAKRRISELIDQMEPDMLAMIVSFNDDARVVQGFTSNRRQLQSQLESIQLSARTTDLLGALQLADGLANPGPAADAEADAETATGDGEKTTLYIFSDGRFADVKDFSLGNLQPQFYVPMGSRDAPNLAITAVNVRQSEARPDVQQAFVQVSNFADTDRSVVVELSHHEEFLDAELLEVPAGEARGVTFSLDRVPPGALVARLTGDAAAGETDVLEIDNKAYAVIDDTSSGRVLLVTPGNKLLMTAMATERIGRYAEVEVADPQVLATDEHQTLAESGAYDLIIYDRCEPAERMPRANTLFVGRVPRSWLGSGSSSSDQADADQSTTAAAPRVSSPQIIDHAREHPLLAHTELGDFYIVASHIVEPPPGGSVLIDSTDGPLLSIAPRDGFEDAVLGFELVSRKDGSDFLNTNWYLRYSFPTFLLNTLGYFAGQGQQSLAPTNLPGRSLALRTESLADELTVVGPAGFSETVRRNEDGAYLFHRTETPGYYELKEGEQVVGRFAVNLFDRQESDVRIALAADEDAEDRVESAASLRIGHTEVDAQRARPARRDLWRPLLLLGVGVLLFEWYVYNRRVYL